MSPAGSRHPILVVEDDAGVRELVGSHLARRQYTVRLAESAESLLPDLRSDGLDYSAALVDIHLPGMSGVELARLLMATRPLVPVIVITGDDDEGLAREALGEGVAAYLLKPFQLFELDAAVAQAVSIMDLVETTEALARSQSRGLEDWGESGGELPRSWLHLGDEKSGAEAGHGARVVSMAGLIAKVGAPELDGRDRERIRTAGRTHEIGRITGTGGASRKVAARSAQLLQNLGFDPHVCELVREAAEPWSPGLPLTARILGLADRLDHDAVRREGLGDDPADAIRDAVDAVVARAGRDADPRLAEVLETQREQIESMWVLQRGLPV